MKYLLIPFLFLGCTGTAHNTHLQVADAVSVGINTAVPTIVDEYKVQLRTCRVEAASLPDYQLCASKVDEKWSHFRDLWRNIRQLQDRYATALEHKDPGLTDYVQWLQESWCQLKTVAPFKLPEVPGLVCKDE